MEGQFYLIELKKIKEETLEHLEKIIEKMMATSNGAKLKLRTHNPILGRVFSRRVARTRETESNKLIMIKDYFNDKGYNVEVISDISYTLSENPCVFYELIFRKKEKA